MFVKHGHHEWQKSFMIALLQNVHRVLLPRKHRVVFPAPMEMTHQKFIYFCEIQIQVNSTITSAHQFHDSINCIRIVNIKLIVNSHRYKICGLWIVSFRCWHFLETFQSMRLQSVAQNMCTFRTSNVII